MDSGDTSTVSKYNDEHMKDIKKWRPVLYRLAATGLSYPDRPFAATLVNNKFLAGMKEVSRYYQFDLVSDFESIKDNLTDKEPETLLEKLESEYVRLFIADMGGARVNPFGSHYLDGEIMGETVDKVVSCYRESGMVKREGYHGQPDHIAVELEYLYKLAQTTQKRTRQDKHTEQVDFYDRLLRPWLGEFTSQVEENTEVRFYSLFAEWVRKGLKADRELLDKLVEDGFSDQNKKTGGPKLDD